MRKLRHAKIRGYPKLLSWGSGKLDSNLGIVTPKPTLSTIGSIMKFLPRILFAQAKYKVFKNFYKMTFN